MSTVLGFPDATSPTPNTGVLWLTEGSGGTRDKKVPAGTLMKDLLGRAVNEQSAAAAPIAGATDLLPVARGNTGGKASVDAVIAAGLPAAVEGLATEATLDGTEYVPVRTASNTVKRSTVSALFPHIVVANTAVTLSKYNNGSDSLLSVDGGATSSIQIMTDPAERASHVHAALVLDGKTSSSSNSNLVVITLDMSAISTVSLVAALGFGGMAFAAINTLPYKRLFAVYAVYDDGADTYTLSLADVATGAAITWATLAPADSVPVSLSIDIFGTKAP